MVGRLEVICGSMFSGKSEELMYRLRRAEFAKRKVITIKHESDKRKSFTCIVSHNGEKREAHPLSDVSDLKNLIDETVQVVGIDEIQFFPLSILSLIHTWMKEGKRVVVAGLDLDFRGEPFGVVPTLLAIADDVMKLHAICLSCGEEAHFSQRLIDGVPAKYEDPTILVGGKSATKRAVVPALF